MTAQVVQFMRRLAASRELGIRRLVLVGNGELVEVSGEGVGVNAMPPAAYRKDGSIVGIDRYMNASDAVTTLIGLIGRREFSWLRFLDGIVAVSSVGDGRYLIAETIGNDVASGTLLVYMQSLARFVRDGTRPRLPRDPPS